MISFLTQLNNLKTPEETLDFCRKHILHGTPWLFNDREDEYYEFRKKISKKFSISFHEIYITGSAQLGFSPRKKTIFSLESDIDVAIVSEKLYDEFMESIRKYQMELRENRRAVTIKEIDQYHKFLEYSAIGWMRPDLLPHSFRVKNLKDDWFDFFTSLSYGKSEAGNYKVNAGIFKTYAHIEQYTFSGIESLKRTIGIK
jgi:predicted nucleotidyltransferase